ncbi:MAG TPA: hypothetical protein VFW62_05680, partial [bacterium]|nr:hypothetical protein [bacterium]
GLSLLKFGSHAAAFTVAERGYGAWLEGERFFDPGMSFSENLGQLGWETALNAGMFAFLGRAFHAFEKRVVLPLARSRALAKVGADEARLGPALLGAERQALLERWTTGIPLRLGRFGAELLAFGQWEAIALNLELNRENRRKGRGLELSLPLSELFSLAAWEERFVFLIALKAGGLLAGPIAKPLQQGLMAWLPQPPARAPAAAEPSAAEAPRETLKPEDYLDSLSGKNPIGSGGMMQAFEYSRNPDQILLLPNDAWWEGREIGSGNPEFDRVYLRETLENYERLAPLRYRGRPLAPRIDGLIEDSQGQILGFLMERVPGENLHDLIEAGKISPRQMTAVEARLREQLELLHRRGLSHGDAEFRNVHVLFGPGGELLDARFLDFTRPKPDRYEPIHGTPAYDREVFGEELKQADKALRGFGGGHDGPLKPKAEDVAKFIDLYESGEEDAGLSGLVELAEQGLAQAVLEMLVLKLGPGTGDRLKVHEALASVRPAGLAERAPEEYPALRALLELAASGNEAAQSAASSVSLAALRKALALPPDA